MNRVNSDKRGDDKMIIQTGMRTDIPAFYSKWFLNRIKEGYVCVRNPYNPKHLKNCRVSWAQTVWNGSEALCRRTRTPNMVQIAEAMSGEKVVAKPRKSGALLLFVVME